MMSKKSEHAVMKSTAFYLPALVGCLILAIIPLVLWFGVRPAHEAKQFRNYRHIPEDQEIVFYRQSYGRDTDKFALIQLPEGKLSQSSAYRPIPGGVRSTVRAISKSLRIPRSKLPNLSKRSIRYYGGENEAREDDGIWMFLTITDIETNQKWIMEYGY